MRPAVVRTSAPSPAPVIADRPSARAARSRARWLIDLSPGRPGRAPQARAAARTPATSAVGAAGQVRARLDRQCLPVPPTFSTAFEQDRVAVQVADLGVDGSQAGHQLGELGDRDRLLAVGQRLVRARVDLDHDPVGARRDAGQRHRLDQPALAGGVRRIDDHRQVGQVVEQGHGRQVERVAGVRLEGPDAALAQDHVGIARADDVLGGHQPLLDRRAVAALEHDWPATRPTAVSSE